MSTPAASADLERAIEWLAAERETAVTERNAFESLRDEVTTIEPAQPTSTTAAVPAHAGTLSVGPTPDAGFEQFATAFTQTVMAAPHYTEEYGDDLIDHVATELTPTIASLMAEKEPLTQPIFSKLMLEIDNAITRRERGIALFDTEHESLTDVRETLEPIHGRLETTAICPIDRWTTAALETTLTDLTAAQETCEQLVTDRQEALQACRDQLSYRSAASAFESYMYPTTSATYPGLAALTTTIGRLQTTRERFRTALTTRGVDDPTATESDLHIH